MAERKPSAFVTCFAGRESMSPKMVESMTCGHSDGPQFPNHTEHSALRPTPRLSSLNLCVIANTLLSADQPGGSLWL